MSFCHLAISGVNLPGCLGLEQAFLLAGRVV